MKAARNWIRVGLKQKRKKMARSSKNPRNWIRVGLKRTLLARAGGRLASRNWIRVGLKQCNGMVKPVSYMLAIGSGWD